VVARANRRVGLIFFRRILWRRRDGAKRFIRRFSFNRVSVTGYLGDKRVRWYDQPDTEFKDLKEPKAAELYTEAQV
jgi:hypothetical protein